MKIDKKNHFDIFIQAHNIQCMILYYICNVLYIRQLYIDHIRKQLKRVQFQSGEYLNIKIIISLLCTIKKLHNA